MSTSGFVSGVSAMRYAVRPPSATAARCPWASARYAEVLAEVLGREERREVWRV